MTIARSLIIIAAILAPALAWMTWHGYQAAEGGGVLPPAPHHIVRPSTEHLDLVVAVALQYEGRPAISQQVRLNHNDKERFAQHFATIAPAKGWYAHAAREHLIEVVMPAGEIDELTDIESDRLEWVLAHNTKPDTPAKGPSSLDLVKVHLSIRRADPSQRTLLVLGTMATFYTASIIAAVGVALAANEVYSSIKNRKDSKTSTRKDADL